MVKTDQTHAKAAIQPPEVVEKMFDQVAKRYDLLNRLLTAGLDQHWRRLAVKMTAADENSRVLDACAGTGDLAFMIQSLTQAQVVGVDFSREMLEIAKGKAAKLGVGESVSFEVASVDDLPFPDDQFDAITIGFGLRNTSDYAGVLKEFRRVVKPGGRVVVLEFSMPTFAPFRSFYRGYLSTVVPAIGRLFADDFGSYKYLADSIKQFPVQKALAEMMRSVGWTDVRYKNLLGGIVAIHVGVKEK